MMTVIKWLLILLLGGLFLTSGGLKLIDPQAFGKAILNYRLVGESLAWLSSLWIPWMEVIGAVGLFIAKWRRSAVWLLGTLIVVFEVILLVTLFRGLDIDCGCFGTKSPTSVSFALMRNIIILGGLVLLNQVEDSQSGSK